MKPLLIIIIGLIATLPVKGQKIDTLRKVNYAIDISRFITQSGFRPGTGIEFTYIADQKKSLSLGFFYCPEQKKISGITVHHEHSLRSPLNPSFSPYLFYHMIYRFTRTEVAKNDPSIESTYGLYKSMEHHIGMGMNIKISKNLHIKAAMGYGVYFGSIKKPVTDPGTHETVGSNGFSVIGITVLEYAF